MFELGVITATIESPSVVNEYEVTAVRYGALRAAKSDLYHRYAAYGEPDQEIELAYYFWVLRGAGETILVDTGFDPVAGERRGRTCLCPPVTALRRIGVEPEDVSTVIVTHCHFDHIGNLAAFPEADIVAPRKEVEFWTSPVARRAQFAAHVEPTEIVWLDQAVKDGRARLIEGTEEILDGITAIDVGGHSPGQQILVVTVHGGQVVVASDAVHFYEELELDRPFGIIADLEQMYRAYDLLNEFTSTGAVVIPGHDPQVLERFPSIGAESDPFAVQVA